MGMFWGGDDRERHSGWGAGTTGLKTLHRDTCSCTGNLAGVDPNIPIEQAGA